MTESQNTPATNAGASTAETAHVPVGPYQARIFGEHLEQAKAFRTQQRELGARIGPPEKADEPDLSELDEAPEEDTENADTAIKTWIQRKRKAMPPANHCAVRLMMAALMDANPDMMTGLLEGNAFVCIDVPDAAAMAILKKRWKDVLLPAHWRTADFASGSLPAMRPDYDAVSMIIDEPVKPRDVAARDAHALTAYQSALPLIAITPNARSFMAPLLCGAADFRLEFPPMNELIIRLTIEIVTGEAFAGAIDPELVRQTGLDALALAVRVDRNADECVRTLEKLAAAKTTNRESRDIRLDQLFGMDEAVAWARSTIKDLKAWRRGAIGWNSISAGICLTGPPGTGKTSFARIFATEAKIPLISATLGGWQGSGEGHLGHLLRAMQADFAKAREQAPSAMFIDEIDTFPDRNSVSHSHRDYVVEVVNSFIAELDGLTGRTGIIFIGATNAVERCDPAILRSGRLGKIIPIGLPNLRDLEKMYRVRLQGDLADADISEVCLMSLGSTGADVEAIVADARRAARHASRELLMSDLFDAARGGSTELPADLLRRAAVHEAGHVLVEVLLDGPAGVHARVGATAGAAGFVVREGRAENSGTYSDYAKMLQVTLAGRAAEEVLLDGPSHGGGGSADSDLAVATRTVCAMFGSIGLGGPHPLVYLGPRYDTEKILSTGYMRAAVQAELAKTADAVRSLLIGHRAALEEIAAHLLAYRRIEGARVAEIIRTTSRSENAQPQARGDLSATQEPGR